MFAERSLDNLNGEQIPKYPPQRLEAGFASDGTSLLENAT
jgi:hypothetical protein